PHAVMMMIPEAWQNDGDMEPEKRAFYAYHAELMEPWDGPACVAFTDGRVIGAVLDRNGLRPSRYMVTDDDLLVLSSEAGVLDIEPERIRKLDRLRPGRMLLVDLEAGRLVDDRELKHTVSTQEAYGDWMRDRLVTEGKLPTPRPERLPKPLEGDALARTQRAFGYTDEDVRMLVGPMATGGKEPIGAMGNDAPMAALSEKPQLLFSYFRQMFAQVTNPPVDPIREKLVMSLRSTLGRRGDLFRMKGGPGPLVELTGPILDDERMQALREMTDPVLRAVTIPALFRAKDGARGVKDALDDLATRVEKEARAGAGIVVLSDRAQNAEWAPIPSLLALSTARRHIAEMGLFGQLSLVVESGEPREVNHFCLLLGYGAHAVHPYLAIETARNAAADTAKDGEGVDGQAKYIHAIEEGLLKVMSKMGISTLSSYRGARLFEALGLSSRFIERYFPGTASRLGGIDLEDVVEECLTRHRDAYARPESLGEALVTGGQYKWRREGEHHAYGPNTVGLLQHATRSGNYEVWKKFSTLVDREAKDNTLRGLLRFKKRRPVPIEEVEPESEIVKRFRTGAMSFGSISKEAHETLARAMNRLGGRSNSGEGGEDPARYNTDRRSAIKQVASGRFGVTSAYLLSATELQIKMAQGA
ncbi:MAG: glutamate synthase subunit alpha, partial [Myxococcales bacterium]|nr:glutamate synthase subunit alpha [Myxococcales bacterium]